jgi:hypothetical protein
LDVNPSHFFIFKRNASSNTLIKRQETEDNDDGGNKPSNLYNPLFEPYFFKTRVIGFIVDTENDW